MCFLLSVFFFSFLFRELVRPVVVVGFFYLAPRGRVESADVCSVTFSLFWGTWTVIVDRDVGLDAGRYMAAF